MPEQQIHECYFREKQLRIRNKRIDLARELSSTVHIEIKLNHCILFNPNSREMGRRRAKEGGEKTNMFAS